MKERIWGLDLGTTSIGFAVVDHDSQEQSGQIIKMGVGVFQKVSQKKNWNPETEGAEKRG